MVDVRLSEGLKIGLSLWKRFKDGTLSGEMNYKGTPSE